MTVFVYVNTAKQVGDVDHIKVFSTVDAAETWFEENDPEGVAFEYEDRPASDMTAVNFPAGLSEERKALSRLESLAGSPLSWRSGPGLPHKAPLKPGPSLRLL